jgi:hypothetical protein
LDGASCGQQLIRTRPDAYVFGEILPAHNPGAIDEKLGGPGNVLPVGATRRMQKLVTPDHFRFRIAEQWECVAFLATQSLRYVGRVDADGNRENAVSLELSETFFDPS